MAKPFRKLPAIALAALLAACLAAFFFTRTGSVARSISKSSEAARPSLVDPRLLDTAGRLASLTNTADEQTFAREALRLADHELDQAFATALREAVQPVGPPNPKVMQIQDRLDKAAARLAADQAKVAQLAKSAGEAGSEQLELAQAQLALDQDELDDARQDIAREGGDPRARVQQELQAHEAAHQQTAALPKTVAATAVDSLPTLKDQAAAWFALGSRERDIEAAREQAAAYGAELSREHEAFEASVSGKREAAAAPQTAEGGDESEAEDTAAVVGRLRRLSDQTKTMSELDRRVDDTKRLAANYAGWESLIESHRRAALHGALGSLAIILGTGLAALLTAAGVRRALAIRFDRRRAHQLRMMATIAVELVAVLAIALIVFGPPTQVTTMIGLATAGLTVVLKDFIVAFCGWFVLMGKNGIRVGDWVEIEGVGGEVVEIGLLRTVLLEMGNWTATGHPTGRRVAFVNGFAIERHFFNFSTAGQWLWDELVVALPASGDPNEWTRRIGETVERETASEAEGAEREWESVTRQYGVTQFKGKPAVSLRPSTAGFEAVVRYITRAPRRVEMRARLFQEIVDMLRQPETAAKPAAV